MMKVLIITPSWKILGGVANHYKGMAPYWKENIKYLFQGKRVHIPAIFTILPDYLKFVATLLYDRPNVVIVNPSLRWYQLVRDSVYVVIALMFRIKVVTFIHGWDPNVAETISRYPLFFNLTFGKSAFFYVLYSKFKDKLESFKIQVPVLLTTTKVSDDLVKYFDVKSRNVEIRELLFLARVEKNKGIMTTIERFKELKKKHPFLKLSICGTGTALESAKKYVQDNALKDVAFWGNVSGKDLVMRFEQADIYVLPTTHGEGMATSVLEAMAFGLPILTCPVGGINDFFEESKMGFFIRPNSVDDIVQKTEWLMSHPNNFKEIVDNNFLFAKKHFLASSVVKRFETDLNKYV